jgi:hypothetical protein
MPIIGHNRRHSLQWVYNEPWDCSEELLCHLFAPHTLQVQSQVLNTQLATMHAVVLALKCDVYRQHKLVKKLMSEFLFTLSFNN